MSSLAQLLLALGASVSGSDRYYDQGMDLSVLKKLRGLGVALFPQDGSAVKDGLDAVVVSTAIEEDNPDLAAARIKKIRTLHRAELLALLAKSKKIIAITGTAGKTTVTGMAGFCLEQAGWDPMVVNGGAVLNWLDEKHPGNFRFGKSNVWVLELDESDRSLLRFFPDWAVVTNISQDHFELAEIKSLFAKFAKQVKRGIVGCDTWKAGDSTELMDSPVDKISVGPPLVGAPSLSFPDQTASGNPPSLRELWRTGQRPYVEEKSCRITESGILFQYRGRNFRLPLLGKHNIENALHCVMLCERLGLELGVVAGALEKFQGIERRLQVAGTRKDVTVIDDYAHNPAKIAAALAAIRPFAKRVFALWRPHGYGPLKLMYRDLLDTFAGCLRPEDMLVVMPVYFAGGTADKQITARMFADELRERRVPVKYAANYGEASAIILKSVNPGDVVLTMGARDPDLPVFARSLVLNLDHFLANRPAGAGGIPKKDQPADHA